MLPSQKIIFWKYKKNDKNENKEKKKKHHFDKIYINYKLF